MRRMTRLPVRLGLARLGDLVAVASGGIDRIGTFGGDAHQERSAKRCWY
jgi:hypothetical protein